MKYCSKCKEAKTPNSFWKNSKAADGLQAKCKPCHSKGQNKILAKNAKLLKQYGISLEDYKKLSSVWNDKCAICENPETTPDGRTKIPRSLAVDHDHKEKYIRGVLCSKCNRGLGMFNDDIKLLENSINYLQAYKEALEEYKCR